MALTPIQNISDIVETWLVKLACDACKAAKRISFLKCFSATHTKVQTVVF